MKTLPMAPLAEPQSCCESALSTSASCCAPAGATGPSAPWIIGTVAGGARPVPVASTSLTAADRWGAWKVRWSFGRNSYTIPPGLYAVGCPDTTAPVLVTANYKLTFDVLRQELKGLDAWILVLDTKGINVWCAAGKGTFGTEEIIKRVRAVNLASVVEHKTLVLPQLGAPGVAAHTVARRTGFNVVYGPVRASDVPAFLKAGMVATAEMRRVHFSFLDRLVLTPVELVAGTKAAVFAFGILFLLNGLGVTGFSGMDAAAVLGAVLAGAVLTPALLPWIPGRMFAVKGLILGLLWSAILIGLAAPSSMGAAGYLLLIPAISAFMALNFTGASTYTSFSGVKKEMERVVMPILGAGTIGTLLLLADAFSRR